MKPAIRKLLAALSDDGELDALRRSLAAAESANDRLAAENRELRAENTRLQQALNNRREAR